MVRQTRVSIVETQTDEGVNLVPFAPSVTTDGSEPTGAVICLVRVLPTTSHHNSSTLVKAVGIRSGYELGHGAQGHTTTREQVERGPGVSTAEPG